MKHFFSIALTILFCQSFFGQAGRSAYDEKDGIYTDQILGGLQVHSGGGGLFLNYGKYKGAQVVRTFGIDAVYMKHEKELKSFNPIYEDGRSYVFGKLNNFFILRATVGTKKIMTLKLRKEGVQIARHWEFGPALGLTKPIYLEIGYPDIPYEYIQTERYDPDRHYLNTIFGRSSGLKGIDEIKPHLGVHFKYGLNFEFSNEKDRLKGIEVGMKADAFLNRIPILAEQYFEKNRRIFLNFYANLYIGKKEYKR